jgi:hypothetical protein
MQKPRWDQPIARASTSSAYSNAVRVVAVARRPPRRVVQGADPFATPQLGRTRRVLLSVRGWRVAGPIAAATVALALAPATLATSSWWPAVGVLSSPGNFGVAANREGGFLLVGAGPSGTTGGEAAYCAPGTGSFARERVYGNPPEYGFGAIAAGSPMFEPDGSAVVISVSSRGTIGKPIDVFEAPAAAPESLRFGEQILYSNAIGGVASLVSVGGARGDIAAAVRQGGEEEADATVRLAGFAAWRPPETLGGGYGPIVVAVDGLGDVTMLRHTEVASAYFAFAGAPFKPLAIPGNYFTAVASDVTGRTAIAGFTATGPLGPGVYLSRRESPVEPFGAPVLLSAGSHDASPQLAYDAGGNLTAAWAEGDHLRVAVAAPGQPLGASEEIYVQGTQQVSDERLAVDPAGEAVLAWAAGPHEERTEALGLKGVPTPLYAAVRSATSESFQTPALLTTAALYAESVNPLRIESGAYRVLDAIGAGRALVAWPIEGPSGPLVEVALNAQTQDCLAPVSETPVPVTSPSRSPSVRWSRRPRRRGRTLILGSVSCPVNCTAEARILVGPPGRRRRIARRRLRVAAGATATLTAALSSTGFRLLRAHPRLVLIAEITITQQAGPTAHLRQSMRLAR